MSDNTDLADFIAVAAGRKPPDLVLRGGQIVNVASCEIHFGNVAIHSGRIAAIGDCDGPNAIDLNGAFVCPGFIDAHVHIESSLLSVPEFARVIAARGTTTVVADPHEFANVMGTEGISFVLRAAKYAPVDVYITLSSCVPASPLESAGATLTAEDLEPFLANPWVLGLAEMMNYPGVIGARPDVLDKIAMARQRVVDGHAPGVRGRDLAAYVAAGIMSDHECIEPAEAAEKVRQGLFIMIREGSQTRNLRALLPLVTPANADRFMFCTDDKDVRDLMDEGQIDYMVRTAISLGMDPILAVRLATLSPARYFGLRDLGAVLPGRRANLTVLDNLRDCRVTHVFHRGVRVAEGGRCIAPRHEAAARIPLRSSVNVAYIHLEDFAIVAPPGTSPDRPPRVHLIHVLENRIDTERSIETAAVAVATPPAEGFQLVADPARDIAKIVVIERHRASGEIGRAFVRGFGLRSGAIASTVAHDAHNLIVVGVDDGDMLKAAVRLVKLHGGLVVVDRGEIVAEVALPVAGLVSPAPADAVAEQLRQLVDAAGDLGCRLEQPFMALSFLSLSVIGKLKLTNQGLIDVEKFAPIALTA
jgi:adenine deaminase